MKALLIAVTALAMMPAAAAIAGDDCHVPRNAWQPPEAAMRAAAGLGWHVDEIEADDGCWEIEGRDAEGRRIKAKLDPATLAVVKLRHRDGDDRAWYGGHAPAAAPVSPPASAPLRDGTAPMAN